MYSGMICSSKYLVTMVAMTQPSYVYDMTLAVDYLPTFP
jgi:hypothetical protein